MIIAFFSLVIMLYALYLLLASKTWQKLPELHQSGDCKKVAVIIPFRNEVKNLPKLMKSLSGLNYPSELLEIILVNDHSNDHPHEVISSFEDSFPFKIMVLNLPPKMKAKKQAIHAGIQHADAEIIITSDADCIFPEDWIEKMQAPFDHDHIQMVSGSVVFKADNLLSRIFQMEFAPLIGVGAVSLEMGKAVMANGANLAFRKDTYISLQPFQDNWDIPGGDDVFLLKKMNAAYPESIFFQKKTVVETLAPNSVNDFYRQRRRWTAKWSASSSLLDALPALGVWGFHLLFITSIFYSLFTAQFHYLLPVLILKLIAEGVFIYRILKSQSQRFSISIFILLQLIYSFYVVIFGLLANFGRYNWKEREYSSYERSRN
jgi:cellulose synthase/poly-beta-1,6-N-acetylglucosamine synthase-like glycosyltransferase